MTNERPVTGSCERCRRGHDLLIPEPGSGDLHLQRIAARFAWCAGCDRVVGQTCCWVDDAGLCADCAAAVETPGSAFTATALTTNAVEAIAGATASMASAEARLRELPVRDVDRARNAWEDAWLEAGVLGVRVERAVKVVRRWAAQVDGARDRMAAAGSTWVRRRDAMHDRLQRVGLRIRALSAVAAPRLTVRAGSPTEAREAPTPSRRGVTTLVGPRPAVSPGRTASPSIRSTRPIAVRPPATPRPSTAPAGGASRTRAAAAAVPPVAMAGAVPSPALPAPKTASAPRTALPARAEPAERPRRAPARRHWVVVALVAALTLIAASVATAIIARPDGASDPGTGATPVAGVPGAGGDGSGSSASPVPAGSGTVSPAGAAAVTFDTQALGPLPAGAEGTALVLGAPEVVALPTSFDRSLRLGAAGDGICLTGPVGDGPARSLRVDLLTAVQPEATLGIVPAQGEQRGAVLRLSDIPGIAPDAWYRVRLSWQAGGAISLEVRPRDGGQAVHRAELDAEPPPDRARAGSVCVEALQASADAPVHIDNVRVDT